eukprot:SM000206S06284  [mRNA]  locus=s206:224727:231723:- [translate_table: standard]
MASSEAPGGGSASIRRLFGNGQRGGEVQSCLTRESTLRCTGAGLRARPEGAGGHGGGGAAGGGRAVVLRRASGARVLVRAVPHRAVPPARDVWLEPATPDDWEMLEANRAFLEDHLLAQVGVVWEGQRLPVWVQHQACLQLRVLATTPAPLVRLTSGAQLIVAPKERSRNPAGTAALADASGARVHAWLRVQHLPAEVARSTVAFVSPITAADLGLNEGCLVTICTSKDPRTPGRQDQEQSEQNKEEEVERAGLGPAAGKPGVAWLLYHKGAARGHVVLSPALRLQLGASTYTRLSIFLRKAVCTFTTHQLFLDDAGVLLESANKTTTDANLPSALSLLPLHLAGSNYRAGQAHHELMLAHGQAGANGLLRAWVHLQTSEVHLSGGVPVVDGSILLFPGPTRLASEQGGMPPRDKARQKGIFFMLRLHWDGDAGSESKRARATMLHASDLKGGAVDCSENSTGLEVRLGQVQHVDSKEMRQADKLNEMPLLASLTWHHEPAASALTRVKAILCGRRQALIHSLGTPAPGGVVLFGSQASGKSTLAMAIARELHEDTSVLAHTEVIRCADLAGRAAKVVKAAMLAAVTAAVAAEPALLLFLDLDMLLPAQSSLEQQQGSSGVTSELLADIVESAQFPCQSEKLERQPRLAFMATARAVEALPERLCASGRLDYHVEVKAPGESQRAAVLEDALARRGLSCSPALLTATGASCQGYEAADMEVLVDRAVHAAAPRLLQLAVVAARQEKVEGGKLPKLEEEDFRVAQSGFVPANLRKVARQSDMLRKGRGWADVGGLLDVQKALQEVETLPSLACSAEAEGLFVGFFVLDLPVRHKNIFKHSPLRMRSGVLLYGPPGCGKTHLVAAAAAATSLRFIQVKGPELLNKYIGASEQAVRSIFAQAAAAAPCILFFDEFDAIAPKRGHDNTGVTDRVVNQLLTELDGVEGLTGVFVIAATRRVPYSCATVAWKGLMSSASHWPKTIVLRPDLIDAALLRPGRLDRLLLCDFPTTSGRVEILHALSHKVSLVVSLFEQSVVATTRGRCQLPLGEDVDLEEIASLADGFSGADLQAVLSDAQLATVHQVLEDADNQGLLGQEQQIEASQAAARSPMINMQHLRKATKLARPSVTGSERARLSSIYDAFIISRSMGTTKVIPLKLLLPFPIICSCYWLRLAHFLLVVVTAVLQSRAGVMQAHEAKGKKATLA